VDALGIFNYDLWAAPDYLWEVILCAMKMVATGAVKRKITPQQPYKE
jgi:hypothetical protein